MTGVDRDRLRKLIAVHRTGDTMDTTYGLAAAVPALLDELEAAEAQIAAVQAAMRHPYKGPNDTDASMLLAAAMRLDGGYLVGGQHTRAAVARVLRVVAALAPTEQPAPDSHKARPKKHKGSATKDAMHIEVEQDPFEHEPVTVDIPWLSDGGGPEVKRTHPGPDASVVTP